MERRTFKRIPVNTVLTLLYSDDLYPGIVEDVSEEGICFSTTDVYIHHGALVELLIPQEEKLLRVHVKVNLT